MKKNILFVILSVCLFGCTQTVEEKIDKYIKEDMKRQQVDEVSPGTTTIDSAFSSLYDDSLAVYYARYVSSYQEKLRSTQFGLVGFSGMDVYQLMENCSPKDMEKLKIINSHAEEYLDKARKYKRLADAYIDSIKIAASEFKPEYIGWEVTYRPAFVGRQENSTSVNDFHYLFDPNADSIMVRRHESSSEYSHLKSVINTALIQQLIVASYNKPE